jgi:hypothetical protein
LLFYDPIVLDRRSKAVKALIRAFCLALVTVGTLGLAGCGPDNEAEGQKLGKTLGDAGAPAPGTKSEVTQPPAKTQQEYFKRTQEQQDKYKGEMQKKK